MDFGKGETSSPAISKYDYEVFLSFRGPDTRQGLTDCLYHALVDAGIRVFRDDDELAQGDKIDEILTALDNSKICIVVLSPKFAESAWCLREVERMVDMRKDILPIFFHVTPDDVKLKTWSYAGDLMVHEAKHGKERVQLWREALREIPTIKGRELKTTGFVEFSRKIAKEILTKLKVKNKYEIDNFVEVEDEVEDALKLLNTESGGCRFLAIHGMGGIGKTTLAKVIFNQIFDSFDCSCFLENVRNEVSQGRLQKLQEQLLRSLDPSQWDAAHTVDAIVKIKNNFTMKKVLIVLDDIDRKNHIRDLVGSFGSGSRIIFTTRKAELHEQGTSSDSHFYGLEKKEMDSKQARKLFSRHAFGEDSPPDDFKSLSAEVISTTGGLPLALEVVGSFLHRRKAKVWRDMIKKLKEAPHHDVQARLKISYDALDDKQQEIFLDIACFFIGQEKRNAVYMWEACEFDPTYGIEVLISMSLIKLKEEKRFWLDESRIRPKGEKCFWMHDQLRDLGRAIVKVNSKDDRAGSRLWMGEDALNLLKTNKGKEKVEALHLCSGSSDCENFAGLEKLRYLRLADSVDLGGDFGGLIPNLRWLSLLDASSFTVFNLCLRELVVLELSRCSFYDTWQGWGQILILEQLKVLTLSDCKELTSMPDLSKLVNLEQLVLKDCKKLASIHSSIGKLQCLSHLIIIVNEMPWTNHSIHLPESIGYLVSLTRLQLESVGNLPNSIGELVKLKHLSLRDSTHLRVLPDSVGDLRSLISLDLYGSGITELPSTIGRLAKLESLCLAECKMLQRLPNSIGNLQSLIYLDMSGTSIVELPSTIGRLAKLESLYLANCAMLQRLPDSIGNLHSLIDLYIMDTDIVELPHSFGNLTSLQKFNFSISRVTSLPDSFRDLEKLESLGIQLGDCIEEQNQLPSGEGGKKILNFSNLLNLSRLEIEYDMDDADDGSMGSLVLEGIEQLIKLELLSIEFYRFRSLSMEWGALQQLKSLTLECASLEFGKCRLPCSLESLDLRVKEWRQLPIESHHVTSLSMDWGALRQLKVLRLYCPSLEFGRCRLSCSLESLDLEVKEWGELPINLSSLKNLSVLNLKNFVIDEEDSFEGLESLKCLEMEKCIIKFKDFPVLKSLRKLVLSPPHYEEEDGEEEEEIRPEFQIQLSKLYLSELKLIKFSMHEVKEGCESLVDLKTMDECTISEFANNVSVLQSLTSLRIEGYYFPKMTCLHIPPQLNCLVELEICLCSNVVYIQGIGKLKSLKTLRIGRCDSLRKIGDLFELKGPVSISIHACSDFEGIDGVERLLSTGILSLLSIRDCKCLQEYGRYDIGDCSILAPKIPKSIQDSREVLPKSHKIPFEKLRTMDPPYEVPCEIASGEGVETSSAVPCEITSGGVETSSAVPCAITSGEGVETSSAVISKNDFEVFSGKATVDPGEVPPTRHEIASEEGETSSAVISKNDYEVFSLKASVDPCEVLPESRKMAFEMGETSSSAISKNDYEVFLSFRGPDTRRGFADNLYHAMVDARIRVFKDDDELAVGDKIDEVLTALHNSKICMVLLSPTFAVSAWCLGEVERMVDMKKDIVPIFYDVTPDDVKLETELYDNALTMHENKYGKEQVQKWREALKEIPTIKGWTLKNTGFVEFSRKIAKEILTKLKVKHMYEIENFVEASKLGTYTYSVGMGDQVKEVIKLLDVECGGMFFVGIHGIDGVGKTTLAKAVFDQLSTYFQVCSFIRDIRERSKRKGFQCLKDELLSKILGTNKDDEMETMKDKLFNKKILIVLDDVDHKEQIKNLVGKFSWFGSGSRIIITTRNKNVMAIEHERSRSSAMKWPKFKAFEMKLMEHDLALQLLRRHAIGEDSSSNARSIICEDIVKATGGLPLALDIVGSYLGHKTAEQWESPLNKLKNHEDMEEKLKISYEALKHETQQIFLDIACFFCNKELSFPLYMWGACGYSPDQSIEVLRLRSLIKIVDDNKLWMHDLVRDFGRKIVRESAMDPVNRSRLWVHDEILYILEKKEETEIEAIGVDAHDFPWDLSLSWKELEGLPKLRYLELCRFQFAEDLAGCSLSNLKWLSWNFCPPDFKATNLCLESLVILDLSRSRITHQWGGWAEITMANLEVLNLSSCKYLTSTPDLSGYKKLESLILEDCVSLATIDSSIGKLEKLKHLNLKGCISLSKLPEELFRAKSLEKILVSGKGQYFEVPELIGGLTQLSVLEIANVKTTAVPSDIGELKSLVRLDFSGADVTELPKSFGSMMKALTVIKLDSSSIRRLPSSIGNLWSLEELYCSNCEELKEIPDEIGELYWLRILDLSFTGISHLPKTISKLSLLETLNLETCNELLELPRQLPESLVNLSVASKKLMSMPDLSVLKSVVNLKLTTGCESSSFDLNSVGKLHLLKTLELCFPLIAGLEFAAMTELYSLCLSSQNLQCFSQLQNLSRLKKLTFLGLHDLSVNVDKGEVGFEELESVEHLSVHNCEFNSLPKKLRAVYISKCKFPDGVLDLTGLNLLVHLEIMDCEQLTHVRGVAGLESLEEINICDCKSLETVESLSNLNCLEALTLDSCGKLREVMGLNGVVNSLKQFQIYDCESLEEPQWSPRSVDENEEN